MNSSTLQLNIVCIAGNLYDQKPWTNRQNVMTRYARLGSKILYVEPPKNIFTQFLKWLFGIKPEQKVSHWFKRLFVCEEREINLYIFSLIKFLPTRHQFLRRLNYIFNLPRLNGEIKKRHMKGALLWIYTPEAVSLAGKLGERVVIYDCVDEYSAQPYYKDNFNGIRNNEEELLRKAGIVFVSSPRLAAGKRLFNKNTFFIPNACDWEQFAVAERGNLKTPKDILGIRKPIIGFIGALDHYKVDFGLIQRLAERNKNLSIVLIGTAGEAERKAGAGFVNNYKNIYLLGKKDYKDLPAYISAFDVAIIPYVSNDYTRCCFPLKLFDFLACGKPVVVSGIDEFDEVKGFVKYANGYDDFEKVIYGFLENDSRENKKRRILAAKENSWENKIKHQTQIIRAYYDSNR